MEASDSWNERNGMERNRWIRVMRRNDEQMEKRRKAERAELTMESNVDRTQLERTQTMDGMKRNARNGSNERNGMEWNGMSDG